jgi:hypothetical protein
MKNAIAIRLDIFYIDIIDNQKRNVLSRLKEASKLSLSLVESLYKIIPF